ncbi:formate dehydrogenase accessory sulfurtransferase FdhD [Rothia nasimurium]|nr:formate dehydrogenase accessory sulfurtransferase FdhD [Luteibacter anthropi]
MHDGPPLSGCATRTMWRYEAGHGTDATDRLAEEVPVAIHLDGDSFAVMMASPLDIEDFARGFALTEGLLCSADDIAALTVEHLLEGIKVNIESRAGARLARDQPARTLPSRTACGICGTRDLEDVIRQPPNVGTGPVLHPTTIQQALQSIGPHQHLNTVTGAVHAAAWFDTGGNITLIREDVGRHNALDKLIGAMLVANVDPQAGFALITSRASYEMVTKAATAGITTLVAISAPTALAVQLAKRCGVTLAGFARPGRFNVYSHPQRIQPAHSPL